METDDRAADGADALMAVPARPAAEGKMRPPPSAAPHVVTATGSDSPQADWDATDNAPAGRWVSVDAGSGPTDSRMRVTGEFPDGPGYWKQT